MLKLSDYPKDKYSAYFEIIDNGAVKVARIYDRETGEAIEHKGPPEDWIKTEMAKRKI